MKVSFQLLSAPPPNLGNPARAETWGYCRWPLAPWAILLLAVALAGCGTDPVSSGAKVPGDRASKAPAIASASGPGASSTNGVALVPKSVFQLGAQSGRDPFFPDSNRGTANTDGALASRLPLVSYLKLLGIRPGTTRPMALINRTAFAPGEEGDVSIVVPNPFGKAEVEKVSIRCLEIRRDSVLISIAGEEGSKELRMSQGK